MKAVIVFCAVFVGLKCLEVYVIRPSMDEHPKAWMWGIALLSAGLLAFVGYEIAGAMGAK